MRDEWSLAFPRELEALARLGGVALFSADTFFLAARSLR
jgi:hypothetical protein